MAAVSGKDQIIAKLRQLPSIPVVLQEIVATFKSANVDSATLASKISRDQGLSAKMLRVANSSFYGLPRKTGSIQEALVVMGFNNARALALSMGTMHALAAGPGSGLDRNVYWKRSLGVAGFGRALAHCLKHDAQMAFMAGMFHDVGQLALDICMPEEFASMLEQQKTSGRSLIDIEQERLGCDHAWIGAEVVRRWNFPSEIECATRHWRTLSHGSFEPVTDIVHVGVLLESGLRGDALIGRLPGALCQRMQISWERLEAGMPDMDQIAAEASAILAM